MEVGQGPNWGCSAKEKKTVVYENRSGLMVVMNILFIKIIYVRYAFN
jgi:hypothetical protein